MFTGSYLIGPKDLQKVSGACPLQIAEVGAKTKFVEKSGRAWSIGIPSSPDAESVWLPGRAERLHGFLGKSEPLLLQAAQCLQKNEVGRLGAVAWNRPGWFDAENAAGGTDGAQELLIGNARGGVAPLFWH